jgi:hypothetical protein
MTCRIHTVDKTIPDFVSSALSGHRDYIINAWFSADMKNVSLFRDSIYATLVKLFIFFRSIQLVEMDLYFNGKIQHMLLCTRIPTQRWLR